MLLRYILSFITKMVPSLLILLHLLPFLSVLSMPDHFYPRFDDYPPQRPQQQQQQQSQQQHVVPQQPQQMPSWLSRFTEAFPEARSSNLEKILSEKRGQPSQASGSQRHASYTEADQQSSFEYHRHHQPPQPPMDEYRIPVFDSSPPHSPTRRHPAAQHTPYNLPDYPQSTPTDTHHTHHHHTSTATSSYGVGPNWQPSAPPIADMDIFGTTNTSPPRASYWETPDPAMYEYDLWSSFSTPQRSESSSSNSRPGSLVNRLEEANVQRQNAPPQIVHQQPQLPQHNIYPTTSADPIRHEGIVRNDQNYFNTNPLSNENPSRMAPNWQNQPQRMAPNIPHQVPPQSNSQRIEQKQQNWEHYPAQMMPPNLQKMEETPQRISGNQPHPASSATGVHGQRDQGASSSGINLWQQFVRDYSQNSARHQTTAQTTNPRPSAQTHNQITTTNNDASQLINLDSLNLNEPQPEPFVNPFSASRNNDTPGSRHSSGSGSRPAVSAQQQQQQQHPLPPLNPIRNSSRLNPNSPSNSSIHRNSRPTNPSPHLPPPQQQPVLPRRPVQQLSPNPRAGVQPMQRRPSAEANNRGTMEIYYTNVGESEVYRQRDNSGKFIKFRYVEKKSGQTEYCCVAPLPNPHRRLTLYFNNNPNEPFEFDETGYMSNGWDQEEGGSDNEDAPRKYDQVAFWNWISPVIRPLLRDSSNPVPLLSDMTIPTEYPTDIIYSWTKLKLPVHPEELRPGDELDVKALDPVSTAALDKVKEFMDDGGNWIKIELKQGGSGAKYMRDMFGNPPHFEQAMVLFFGGIRQYFDKNGLAMSSASVQFVREAEAERKRVEEQNRREQRLVEREEQLYGGYGSSGYGSGSGSGGSPGYRQPQQNQQNRAQQRPRPKQQRRPWQRRR